MPMKTALALAVAFGLSVGAASACPFEKTVDADTMSTASIEKPMSTADSATVDGSSDTTTVTGATGTDTLKSDD
jgi:hypothetical protein